MRHPFLRGGRVWDTGLTPSPQAEVTEGNVVVTHYEIRGLFNEVTDVSAEVQELLVLLDGFQAALVGGNDLLGLSGQG